MWTAKLCEINVIKTIAVPGFQETLEYPEFEQVKDKPIIGNEEFRQIKTRVFKRMLFKSYNAREAIETTHYLYFDVDDAIAKLPVLQEAINYRVNEMLADIRESRHKIELERDEWRKNYYELSNRFFSFMGLKLKVKYFFKKIKRLIWHW